jgi:hypothetical protein
VLIPLEDGGARKERVLSLFDWQRSDYRQCSFGREPLLFGIMWPGHRLGTRQGGRIVPA